MSISWGSILSNPVWRAKNAITHISPAQAPTLWDFDANGFASPSNSRTQSSEEVMLMNVYNAQRAQMNDAARRAVDSAIKNSLPMTGGISPTTNTATTSALNWVAPRRDPLGVWAVETGVSP